MAVAASQMRAVLSCDAVTMRDPSGLKAADYTPALVAAQDRDLLAGRGVPDAGGLSSVMDAVTMRDPSGLKAADDTACSWPRSTAISLPVAASQSGRCCPLTP